MSKFLSPALGASLLLAALACGGGGSSFNPPPSPPAITSFQATQTTISYGASTDLLAQFTGGTGSVNQGVGPVTAGVPIATGALNATTTFTLTVAGSGGPDATALATVTVEPPPAIAVLDVTLVAAPAGATVKIFGPSGFEATLTASGTLTALAAGDYALVPAGIWSAGEVYQAAGAGTVTLGQGATASATLTYAPLPSLAVMVPDTTSPGSAVELDLATVPAGTFQMGAYAGEQGSVLEEVPQHPVTLSQFFYLGEYPVTQALWRAVMGGNPAYFSVKGGGSATDDLTRPVESVSWNDITTPATGFLALLNAATAAQVPAGTAFRLPTEAEWEYACRAGTSTRFYWGDDLNDTNLDVFAWWSGDSGAATHPVGAFGPAAANAFGLRDMNGNVFEWCQDWFGPYAAGAQTDPAGAPTGTYRIVRGGDWYQGAPYCRSANRSMSGPADSNSEIGLRLVLAAAP